MGNVFCICDVTPHSFVKYGMALLGSALPIVELTTVTMLAKTINDFFPCTTSQSTCFDDRGG